MQGQVYVFQEKTEEQKLRGRVTELEFEIARYKELTQRLRISFVVVLVMCLGISCVASAKISSTSCIKTYCEVK